MINFPIPLLGFAAWSGTGKTTLLCQLIPLLTARNIRVALVKHAHHDFDIDYPGKDSYKLRKAGAEQVVIASRQRIASILETPAKQAEPNLEDALAAIEATRFDLVLVEGFKLEPIPKIELHRVNTGKPYLFLNDEHIFALAQDDLSEDNLPSNAAINILDLNDPAQIADFISDRYGYTQP